MKDLYYTVVNLMLSPFYWLMLKVCGVRYDVSWRFYGMPMIRVGGHGSSIEIGRRFKAVSSMHNNSWGIAHRVTIKTVAPGASIKIGDDVGVSGCAITAREHIEIGNRVLLGAGVLIADHDSHPVDYLDRQKDVACQSRPVKIGDDVFVGTRSIILKGVTIGVGSVVAAGSVVVKEVPAHVVVAGNPAKVVKRLEA